MNSGPVWVVVPAFDEASVIGTTVRSLLTQFDNIVVVDDKSRDSTGDVALAAGAHVCRHPVNLGQGAALQTGFDYALQHGAQIIVTFDADGQHRVQDATAMVGALRRSAADIVLASRFLGATVGMPRGRRLLLALGTWYTRVTTGLDLTDTHNGLRAITRETALRMRLRQNRMAHASEILSQVAELELNYVEHPVTVVYSAYSRAKGQRFTGAFRVLFDLVVRRMYRS
jgi:glycosyltransferase involved in cell wall biosynthesis